jgi:hypothetical protein
MNSKIKYIKQILDGYSFSFYDNLYVLNYTINDDGIVTIICEINVFDSFGDVNVICGDHIRDQLETCLKRYGLKMGEDYIIE